LTALYAFAVLLALVIFAALALLVLHEVQRRALDARLQTAARAVIAVAEENDGSLAIEAGDIAQLSRIAGTTIGVASRDQNGSIVSTTTHVPAGIAALLASSAKGFHDASFDNEPLRVYLAQVGATGRVAVWTSPESVGDALTKTALAFALLIPVVVALMWVAGTRIAERGLRPLRSLAGVAAEIEARDLSRRIALPNADDELTDLCATFDRMLDRLQGAFDRERRFTADASHELRAPLSIIRAEGEVALAHALEVTQYRAAIAAMIRETEHLELLTEDLLEAARSRTITLEPDVGDLGDLTTDAVRRVEPLARQRQVRLSTRVFGPALIDAPLDAVERAILAVLHNALKHTPEGGEIHIELRRTDADAILTIRDGGPGFSSDALDHAFDRFWRTGDRKGGSGLGLAIARETLQDMDGSMTLANGDGGGIVTIHLKLADETSITP
jgi:two-component system OmpR family sensor kinase